MDISPVLVVVFLISCIASFWFGRRISRRRREEKAKRGREAGHALQSRQVRRSRERGERKKG